MSFQPVIMSVCCFGKTKKRPQQQQPTATKTIDKNVHKIKIEKVFKGSSVYKVSINNDEEVLEYSGEQVVEMQRCLVQLLTNADNLKVLHIDRCRIEWRLVWDEYSGQCFSLECHMYVMVSFLRKTL